MFLRNHTPLTIDQIRRQAPSVFAESAHESRSRRYGYIPTGMVVEGLMQVGFQPFEVSQSHSRDESKQAFTKHMIKFRHPSSLERREIKVGDSVPEISLINSHDGSSTYQLFLGIYRFVCTNGMMVSDGAARSIKVQHKGNMVSRVIEGSFEIIQNAPKVMDQIATWSGLYLSKGEQHAFAEVAHQVRFGLPEPNVIEGEVVKPAQPHPIQPVQLLEPRRYDDRGDSLWHVLNRVQENVIRGGLKGYRQDANIPGRTRQISTREVKGIDQNIGINRHLWYLAEKMAELKGVAVPAAA